MSDIAHWCRRRFKVIALLHTDIDDLIEERKNGLLRNVLAKYLVLWKVRML